MKAGRLRILLIIQEKIRKPDSQGGHTEIWVEVCKVYGRVKKILGDTEQTDSQQQSVIKIVWETRFSDQIKSDMQLVNSQTKETYKILSVFDPSFKCERLEISTEVRRCK